MKNSIKIFFVLLLAVGSISCMKSNPYERYDGQAFLEKEAPLLKEFVETTEGLEDAILDEKTGIWYKIIEEGVQPGEEGYYRYKFTNAGNAQTYIEAPVITVKYEGKLVSNGVVFDKSKDDTYFENSLGTVIEGWQIGFLPKAIEDEKGKSHETGGLTKFGLQKNSKIRLIIPSPWGYQSSVRQGIPANSPLDFTIEVIKVSSPVKPQ